MIGRSAAKAATMITASGIEVLIVRPTMQPEVGVGRPEHGAEDDAQHQAAPGPVGEGGVVGNVRFVLAHGGLRSAEAYTLAPHAGQVR